MVNESPILNESPMVNENKVYRSPRLERYGALSELSAGGSGSMAEGSGPIGGASGVSMLMAGPGIGRMDSRP